MSLMREGSVPGYNERKSLPGNHPEARSSWMCSRYSKEHSENYVLCILFLNAKLQIPFEEKKKKVKQILKGYKNRPEI